MARGLGQLKRQLRRQTQRAARQVAVEVMNDLAQAGPNWSGQFKNSWVADAPGSGLGKKANYPYKISDVGQLKDTVDAVKQETKIRVYNTANYALIAQDLEEGRFFPDGNPKGRVIKTGKRSVDQNGLGIRGKLQGDGGNQSTAELDWFMSYLDGGGLQKALERGVKIGFKRGV